MICVDRVSDIWKENAQGQQNLEQFNETLIGLSDTDIIFKQKICFLIRILCNEENSQWNQILEPVCVPGHNI